MIWLKVFGFSSLTKEGGIKRFYGLLMNYFFDFDLDPFLADLDFFLAAIFNDIRKTDRI
jgi:hypothetical protein